MLCLGGMNQAALVLLPPPSPEVVPGLAEYTPRVKSAVRVAARPGDFLRVADSLRLALEIAETAVELAEQRGAGKKSVDALRRSIEALREAP